MTERIATPIRTKAIMERYGFNFKKGFGQNFLIDSNILENIADAAGISKEDTVLEIGPGIGTLTIELAKKAGKVIAIEQDTAIFNILKKRLEKEKIDNVELINGDAVKVDFPEFNKRILISHSIFCVEGIPRHTKPIYFKRNIKINRCIY